MKKTAKSKRRFFCFCFSLCSALLINSHLLTKKLARFQSYVFAIVKDKPRTWLFSNSSSFNCFCCCCCCCYRAYIKILNTVIKENRVYFALIKEKGSLMYRYQMFDNPGYKVSIAVSMPFDTAQVTNLEEVLFVNSVLCLGKIFLLQRAYSSWYWQCLFWLQFKREYVRICKCRQEHGLFISQERPYLNQ